MPALDPDRCRIWEISAHTCLAEIVRNNLFIFIRFFINFLNVYSKYTSPKALLFTFPGPFLKRGSGLLGPSPLISLAHNWPESPKLLSLGSESRIACILQRGKREFRHQMSDFRGTNADTVSGDCLNNVMELQMRFRAMWHQFEVRCFERLN